MSRGPAYPFVGLQEAIGLVSKLYDYAKRQSVLMDSAMKDAWKISPTSSNAGKVAAALKYFGLIDDSSAPDGKKLVKVSDRAYRILVDAETSPERTQAIRDAALSPRWYAYCWNKWGEDMPQAMRSHLIFEQGFIESTVDTFLKDYKATIEFSGLTGKAKPPASDPSGGGFGKILIKAGDYVQWESGGVLQFSEPRRVANVTDDGFAFVDGSNTGIPLNELQIAEKPAVVTPPKPPLGSDPKPEKGMRREIFSTDEGDVTIQWPAVLSKDSFDDFKDWLVILERKVKRSVISDSAPAENQAEK